MKRLLFLLFVVSAAQAEDIELSLSLNCQPVPAQQQLLCSSKTPSPYGPYHDVMLFNKAVDEPLYLLSVRQNSVSTFLGFGFSKGGRYVWLGWAEEGHPAFVFYRTSSFVESGLESKSIGYFERMEFAGVYEFKDNGDFFYYSDDDSPQNCVDFVGNDKQCVKRFNIIADQ